jgi:L-lactate dehydrogenase complex protein LldG
MSARDDVYANIRRSLGVDGREATRRAAVEQRLSQAPRGIVPARGSLDAAGRLALFQAEAEAAAASVVRVAEPAAIAGEVARYLDAHDLAPALRIDHAVFRWTHLNTDNVIDSNNGEHAFREKPGSTFSQHALAPDSRLAAAAFAEMGLAVETGRAESSDANALSHAFAGVAETGTLVLASGPESPTTLNFLPDNHIVIVRADDIEGDYEAIWQRLRTAYGKGKMPRALNLITGPSRSADIEQEIILGAHGPRRLHILIVG